MLAFIMNASTQGVISRVTKQQYCPDFWKPWGLLVSAEDQFYLYTLLRHLRTGAFGILPRIDNERDPNVNSERECDQGTRRINVFKARAAQSLLANGRIGHHVPRHCRYHLTDPICTKWSRGRTCP